MRGTPSENWILNITASTKEAEAELRRFFEQLTAWKAEASTPIAISVATAGARAATPAPGAGTFTLVESPGTTPGWRYAAGTPSGWGGRFPGAEAIEDWRRRAGLQYGGPVPFPMSGPSAGDVVPTLLEPGEYVLSRQHVQQLGGTGAAMQMFPPGPSGGAGMQGGGVPWQGPPGVWHDPATGQFLSRSAVNQFIADIMQQVAEAPMSAQAAAQARQAGETIADQVATATAQAAAGGVPPADVPPVAPPLPYRTTRGGIPSITARTFRGELGDLPPDVIMGDITQLPTTALRQYVTEMEKYATIEGEWAKQTIQSTTALDRKGETVSRNTRILTQFLDDEGNVTRRVTDTIIEADERMTGFGATLLRTAGYALRWIVVWEAWRAVTGTVTQAIQDLTTAQEAAARLAIIGGQPALDVTMPAALAFQRQAAAFGRMPPEAAGAAPMIAQAIADPAQQLETMANASRLAELSGRDLASSTDNLLRIQRQFGMETRDQTRILDVLVMSYRTSQVTIDEMAATLAQSGAIARMAGMDFETYAATIAKTKELTGLTATETANLWIQMQRRLQDPSVGAELFRMAGVGVMQRGPTGAPEPRPTAEIIEELARKWDTLSEGEQRATAILIGYRTRADEVALILDRWPEFTATQEQFAAAQGEAARAMDLLGERTTFQARSMRAEFRAMMSTVGDLTGATTAWQMAFQTVAQTLHELNTAWAELSGRAREPIRLVLSVSMLGPLGIAGLEQRVAQALAEWLFGRFFGGEEAGADPTTGRVGRDVWYRDAVRAAAGSGEGLIPVTGGLQAMTAAELARLQTRVTEFDRLLMAQRLDVDPTNQQLVVLRDQSYKLERLVGSSEAIQLATREISENTRRPGLYGVPAEAAQQLLPSMVAAWARGNLDLERAMSGAQAGLGARLSEAIPAVRWAQRMQVDDSRALSRLEGAAERLQNAAVRLERVAGPGAVDIININLEGQRAAQVIRDKISEDYAEMMRGGGSGPAGDATIPVLTP